MFATWLTWDLQEQHQSLIYRENWCTTKAYDSPLTPWAPSERPRCSSQSVWAPPAFLAPPRPGSLSSRQKGSCELFENMLRLSCLGDRSLINHSFPVLNLSFKWSNVNSLGDPCPRINVKAWYGGAELQGKTKG